MKMRRPKQLLFLFFLCGCESDKNVGTIPEGTVYLGKIITQIHSFEYSDYEIYTLANGTRISNVKFDFDSNILTMAGVQIDQQNCTFQRTMTNKEMDSTVSQIRQLDICRYYSPIYECSKLFPGDTPTSIFSIVGDISYSISDLGVCEVVNAPLRGRVIMS